jgi:hypothetical protein
MMGDKGRNCTLPQSFDARSFLAMAHFRRQASGRRTLVQRSLGMGQSLAVRHVNGHRQTPVNRSKAG